jgi:hypothetical protein
MRLLRRQWVVALAGLVGVIAVVFSICPQSSVAALVPGTQSESVRIPFDYDPVLRPYIFINVSFNDKAPVRCFLDTGMNLPLVLDQSVAKALGITPDGRTATLKQGGTPIQFGGPARVRVGGVLVRNVGSNASDSLADIAIADFAGKLGQTDLQDVGGIVGLPLLMRSRATFDFVAKTLTLEPPDSIQKPDDSDVVLPLKVQKSLMFVSLPLPAVPRVLLLDTGSQNTFLSAASIRAVAPTVSSAERFSDLEGDYDAVLFLVNGLPIGRHVERQVVVARADSGRSKEILGLDILSRFVVIVDAATGNITLRHPKDGGPEPGLPGLHVLDIRKEADALSCAMSLLTLQSPVRRLGGTRSFRSMECSSTISLCRQ